MAVAGRSPTRTKQSETDETRRSRPQRSPLSKEEASGSPSREPGEAIMPTLSSLRTWRWVHDVSGLWDHMGNMTINRASLYSALISGACMVVGLFLDATYPGHSAMFISAAIVASFGLTWHATKEWIMS